MFFPRPASKPRPAAQGSLGNLIEPQGNSGDLAMWMTTVVKLFAKIRRWHARRSAIAALAALDDRLLKDIGLRRSEIRRVVDSQLGALTAPPAEPGPAAAPSGHKAPSSASWIESCNA